MWYHLDPFSLSNKKIRAIVKWFVFSQQSDRGLQREERGRLGARIVAREKDREGAGLRGYIPTVPFSSWDMNVLYLGQGAWLRPWVREEGGLGEYERVVHPAKLAIAP